MDWEVVGAFSEFIGAVAVVITLIYLAVQLRQNTTSIQTSAYQSWVATHDQFFASLADEDLCQIVSNGLLDTRNLTAENNVLFVAWMRRYLYMQQAQFFLYQKGTIDEDLWDCNMRDLAGMFQFPGARQYWEAGAKEHFTDDFVKLVDGMSSFSPMLQWSKEEGFSRYEFSD